MRITESRLRNLIKSVIVENSFDYDRESEYEMDYLASKLSMIFFTLDSYKKHGDPQKVINDSFIDETKVTVDDVRSCVKQVNDYFVDFTVSYEFLNKLGFDDNIIERACKNDPSKYWTSCDSKNRVVSLGDPSNI